MIWGSYGHAENVRVSLFDRVMTTRERTTSDVFDLHVRFYRHFTEHSQLDLAVFDVGGDARAYGGAHEMEMAFAHWHRRRPNGEQTFRFLQIYAQYLADEDSPDTFDTRAGKIVPLGVEGIALAPNTTGSVLVGWTRSLAYDGERRILDENGFHADLSVTLAVEPTLATFRARHSTLAGFGGQLVRDDRVAASVEHDRERFALRGEGFVARQTVVRNTPGGRSLFTGGAAVDAAGAGAPAAGVPRGGGPTGRGGGGVQ